MTVLLTGLILVLSVLSGMFGIGVAFAAVPFLSLFLPDLVNQVHPLSLLLNGVTALFALAAFARAGFVDWRRGGALALVTTLTAPLGAAAARSVPEGIVWTLYFVAATFVCWRMFRPAGTSHARPDLRIALVLAVPIAVLSGLLGVGPGFLLVPMLMILGFDARRAAAMNAVAVTPSSFAAILPHAAHVAFDWDLALPLCVAGAIGSIVGARLASYRIGDVGLRRTFGVTIAAITLYRAVTMLP